MTKEEYFISLEKHLSDDIENNGDRIMAYCGRESVRRSDQLEQIKNREGHAYDGMILLQKDFKRRNKKPLWDEE